MNRPMREPNAEDAEEAGTPPGPSDAIRHPRGAVARALESSPVLRAILTLMSGTLAAQVIAFALQILIARVYTDTDKGLLGVYGSITALIITLAAARYDLAVMLPKDEAGARSVHRLASRSILLTSLLASLLLILAARPLEDAYHHSGELACWLGAAGVSVALVAQGANLRYWLTRKGRFGELALNGVLNSLAIAGSQLLLGLALGGGFTALILGTMLGQLASLLHLLSLTGDARRRLPGDPPLLEVAKTYRRMPLLNGPNALVDALRNAGINLMIGAVAIASLGQFQLAWTTMQVPVGLIAGAVGQVFLKKLSDTPPGAMLPLVSRTLKRAALAAILPFALLALLAPWFFPLVFGARWDQAGEFARALTPWLFMTVLTSPVSNLFVITQTQKRMLVFGILYCTAPLAWLALTPLDLLATVRVLGLGMAVMLLGLVLMSLVTASQYDRGRAS